MRVLYFSRDYTTHDWRYLASLVGAGHQVAYLRLQRGPVAYEQRDIPQGVRMIAWKRIHRPVFPWEWVRLILDFRRVMREVRPELVHAGPVPSCGFLSALAGVKPLVVMSWGSDVLVDADRNPVRAWATRFTLRRADVVIGDCRAVRDKVRALSGLPDDRIVTYPWGVDLKTFQPRVSSLDLRRRLGWEDAWVFLSTRSWEPHYHVDRLLTAFLRLAERSSRARLLLLGDGSLGPCLHDIIAAAGSRDRVHLAGQVPNGLLPDYYNLADVYVSSVPADGTSISLLEAMACGLPVIVADAPGNREWVTPEKNGWLFKPGDAESLAAAMQASLAPDAPIAAMRETNVGVARARADWRQNFRMLLDAYAKAVQLSSGTAALPVGCSGPVRSCPERTSRTMPPLKIDASVPRSQTASGDFAERAHRLIPGGAHTYSKGDDQFPRNAPRAFVRGKGGRVWDVDGREYVDWGMGIQNVLIGHAEDAIDDAAIEALRRGQNFSRPSPLEVDAAEAVVGLFEGMEMVKFGKNGSDANTAAIRLARAVTSRDLVAYDHAAPFLSFHDWFIGTTVMKAGVPEAVSRLAVPFRYNDLESVERVFAEHPRQLAAVILEPFREVKPRSGFLERLRVLCDHHGTLLIFDEVITAFRYSLHGSWTLTGVRPDLMSLGKGLANGYSLTALVGCRRYMERGGLDHTQPRCFLLSTTNGAEQSALAAGLATIRFYQERDVIQALYAIGTRLMEGINHLARQRGISSYVQATGDFSCRPVLNLLDSEGQPSPAYRALFLQELLKKGVFLNWICPCYRHGESELAQTLEAAEAACVVYARALEEKTVEGLLEGPPVRPVFRTYNECLQSRCGRLYPDAPRLSCCLDDPPGSGERG